MEEHSKQEGGLRIITKNQGIKNKDLPLVSIITPVRNMEKSLERTINSVINQTYPNIEYIIIDGVSTDRTIDIIKKYEQRIHYWVSEPDQGISDAFNKGIHLSSGELIGIINADDWYELDAVEKVIKVFLNDRGAGVIHGKKRLYDAGRQILIRSCPKNLDKLWINMVINHSTCFVKKMYYEQYGYFDISFKVAMDYELLLRFYTHGVKFHYIESVLSNCNCGGESDINENLVWKEELVIHAKYGYSKYYFQWRINLTIRKVKRIIRKIMGRNHPFLTMIRKFTKEQS